MHLTALDIKHVVSLTLAHRLYSSLSNWLKLSDCLYLPNTFELAESQRGPPLQSVATFSISPLLASTKKLQVSAIVVPRVTCDLPTQPVHFNSKWGHLNDLHMADPSYGQPGRIDVLVGVDIYADVLLHGRRSGPPNTPVAFETKFGWVLAGKMGDLTIPSTTTSHHVVTISGYDVLRKFWEIEECPQDTSNYSPEERIVVRHFAENHTKNKDGCTTT